MFARIVGVFVVVIACAGCTSRLEFKKEVSNLNTSDLILLKKMDRIAEGVRQLQGDLVEAKLHAVMLEKEIDHLMVENGTMKSLLAKAVIITPPADLPPRENGDEGYDEVLDGVGGGVLLLGWKLRRRQ